MQGTLSSVEIDTLLQEEVFGHLGCSDGSQPYIVPMAYVFHNNVLYGQTTEGRKIDMLRRNPRVCFQVQQMQDKAWKSVICLGQFEELAFDELQKPEAIGIAKLLTERIGSIQENVGISIPFSFGDGAAPLTVNDKTSTLFRIVIGEKTGRFFIAQP